MAAKKKTVNSIDARLTALRNDFDALQQDIKGLAGDVGAAASERAQLAMRSAEETKVRGHHEMQLEGCCAGSARALKRGRTP